MTFTAILWITIQLLRNGHTGAVLLRVEFFGLSYTIGLIRKSSLRAAEGNARVPFVMVAGYDSMWRPIHSSHRNELIKSDFEKNSFISTNLLWTAKL